MKRWTERKRASYTARRSDASFSATPPLGADKTILAVASARATIASHAVEWVRSQAVHDTATACTKKLSQEMIEPSEYQRKLRSANASAIPPRPRLTRRPGAPSASAP